MGKSLKILLVEDDSDLRSSLFDLLDIDFDITLATNGEEGLSQFNLSKPDVVLTDIKMPKMDGIELLARLQAISKNTPVILMTGHGDRDLAQKAILAGAIEYIEKPMRSKDIYAAIEKTKTKLISN